MNNNKPTSIEAKSLIWVARYCLYGIILMCITLCFVFAKSALPEYRPIIINSRTVTAGTAYQPSTARVVDVSVSVSISCSLSLSGGTAGNWVIQTAPTSTGTWTTVNTITASNTGTLTIGLNTVQISGGILDAKVLAGYWYRIVSTSTTGTATFTILNNAQEELQ